MSEHLNNIIETKNQNCNMQIVFVDIVKYSERTTLNQVKLINEFTKIIDDSIEEVSKENYNSLIGNNIILLRDLIKLPTGDGIAIGIPFNWIKNLHLQLALEILKKIDAINKSNKCQHFESLEWCDCHNNFSVRIGISQGTLILYKDINSNFNIAGGEINMAARVMNKGGYNQIIFTDRAFEEYKNFSSVEEKLKFRKYSNIEIKHNIFIDFYQYFDSQIKFLNSQIISEHKDNAQEEVITTIIKDKLSSNDLVNTIWDKFKFRKTTIGNNKKVLSICQFLVTQELYTIITGENPSSFMNPKKPVENINWFEAIKFCNRLSEKMGITPLYNIEKSNQEIIIDYKSSGFRLPTKAEYHSLIDNAFKLENDLTEFAVIGENETKVVGSKKVDDLGCYDLLGNVWEWCNDIEIENDIDSRWVNGGSYSNFKSQLNKKFYQKRDYLTKEDNIGFRIIKQ